ncbi:hypothetical protein AAY473_034556 [Plecturocebus cupreus]
MSLNCPSQEQGPGPSEGLEWSGVITAHCRLDLLRSGGPCTSVFQVAGMTTGVESLFALCSTPAPASWPATEEPAEDSRVLENGGATSLKEPGSLKGFMEQCSCSSASNETVRNTEHTGAGKNAVQTSLEKCPLLNQPSKVRAIQEQNSTSPAVLPDVAWLPEGRIREGKIIEYAIHAGKFMGSQVNCSTETLGLNTNIMGDESLCLPSQEDKILPTQKPLESSLPSGEERTEDPAGCCQEPGLAWPISTSVHIPSTKLAKDPVDARGSGVLFHMGHEM